MSVRTTPPFRADHVGSLLRPRALLQAREDAARDAIPADELRAIEDDAIRDAVRMQEDIGLRSVTDGEFRRGSWHMDFIYQIAGVQKADQKFKSVFHNQGGDIEFTPAAIRVTGRLGMDHTIFGSAFEFLRDTATTGTPKLTIPAPSLVHYRGGPAAIDHAVYPDMDQFWEDLGAAYADEIRRLFEIGCSYLQLETYIKSINRALRDKPAGMTVTTHMCRGNFRSSWVAQGGYEFVADALFNELNVDGYFMEYDDGRSGGFEPLRLVPKGKYVVLGLVTRKKGKLEAKDDVKRRIEEATKFVDIDQLCLSPQCGFSSTLEGNSLSRDQQIAKLRLVAEVAEQVWGTS